VCDAPLTDPSPHPQTSHPALLPRCTLGRGRGRAQQPGEQRAALERLYHAAEAARGRVERDEVQRQAVSGGAREHDRARLARGAQRGSEGGRVPLELGGGEEPRRLQQAGRHPDLARGALAAL
jgi:hypothetical protein